MPNSKNPFTNDSRRWLVLAIAVVLLAVWAIATFVFQKDGGAGSFASAAAGRIGLVMGALWLAWPSLRRPASWLPPGIAVAGVGALVLLAAQPRLIVVAIPALGLLLAVATTVRVFKK